MPASKTTSKRETLGNNVIPVNYNLVFEPNFKNFKFACSEKIAVKIAEPTGTIMLNADELVIKSASIRHGATNTAAKITINKETQRVGLKLQNNISKGAAFPAC